MLFLIVKAAKLKAGKTGKTGKTGKFDEHKINRDSDGKFSSKPGSKTAAPTTDAAVPKKNCAKGLP